MLGIALSLLICAGDPAPSPQSNPVAATTPTLTPKELSARCRAELAKRVKRCLKLPDGKIIDADQYYEALEVVKSSVLCGDAGYYQSTRASYGPAITSFVVTGKEWSVAPTPGAIAWKLNIFSGVRIVPHIEIAHKLFNPTLPTVDSPAIFIDEEGRDLCAKLTNFHYTQLRDSFVDDIRNVMVFPFAQDVSASVYDSNKIKLQMPKDLKVDSDWIPGRFLLVPSNDPKLSKDHIYEYVPVEEPSIQELIQAVSGGLKLYKWESRREKDNTYTWHQSELKLEKAK